MKIVLAGGSGQLGTVLARAFRARGHETIILSRRPSQSRIATVLKWDARTLGKWVDALNGADALINLVGRSVNCRYTTSNREAILRSRIDSTIVLGEAIRQLHSPPRVWLQSSTATIYAHSTERANDELTGRIGGTEENIPDAWRFSIDVATRWESAARSLRLPHTRLVLMRSSMVMTPDRGGVFDLLLRLVRMGAGGAAGNGTQFVSWIHERDFVEALFWLISHDSLDGAVNVCAPAPLSNGEFMRILRKAWGHQRGIGFPTWALEIGAWVLRTETELLLKSRRVIPTRLLESGFQFQYATWSAAAADLCEQYRSYHREQLAP